MAKEPVIGLRLETEIVEALRKLAEKNGRDPVEQIVFLITEAVADAGLLSPSRAEWHRLRESLILRFVYKAQKITEVEGWRTDIIAETARRMLEDTTWRADYERLIGADAYARNVKLKDVINPALGRRTKLRLGAETGKVFAVRQPSIFTASSHLHPEQPAAEAAQ
ncbi:hypothetical protein [Roseicella aerolata]|uniref:Uncharacterized protein n=1 Tax=Roseicella aerolata TaxID=2883479 RepID=A0A9X1LDN5_9PROT|nr:hypothetical protein [Roseicella aerolata]MCB4825505.1 hypothetical protein [Roseicella aerolata]